MKKHKTWLMLTAVLIVLVLAVCGCGKKKDETPVPSTTKQETKAETKEETKTETKEETTEETTPAPTPAPEVIPSDAECMQIAMTLLSELQYVNRLGAGAIAIDTSVVYSAPNGYDYNLITEPGIQSFYDIYHVLYDNFTDGCIDSHWRFLLDPEGGPEFIMFVDGQPVPTGLYLIQAGRGYLDYVPTGNIGIEHVDDRHFRAIVPFSAFGETLYLTMDIVQEGEDWKINDFVVE